MIPISFYARGPLERGHYLTGLHQLPVQTRALSAKLYIFRTPTNGTLTLELEVNGALSGTKFTVGDVGYDYLVTQSLNFIVPQNATLRWKASAFDGAPEDGASDVSVLMQLQEG